MVLYVVGAAKTGTHSIASMFDHTVRARHEPGAAALIRVILRPPPEALLLELVRSRGRRLGLDVDSSQLNAFILPQLLEAFPDARFLLTLRDCYSWLESLINASLGRPVPEPWLAFRDYRFRRPEAHPPEERALQQRGLYTLDGYLSYWARHNNDVLARVPPQRLMVVRTDEITARAEEIAAFAGLDSRCLRQERSHTNESSARFHVLREIPEAHLEAKVDQHCRSLMERFF